MCKPKQLRFHAEALEDHISNYFYSLLDEEKLLRSLRSGLKELKDYNLDFTAKLSEEKTKLNKVSKDLESLIDGLAKLVSRSFSETVLSQMEKQISSKEEEKTEITSRIHSLEKKIKKYDEEKLYNLSFDKFLPAIIKELKNSSLERKRSLQRSD